VSRGGKRPKRRPNQTGAARPGGARTARSGGTAGGGTGGGARREGARGAGGLRSLLRGPVGDGAAFRGLGRGGHRIEFTGPIGFTRANFYLRTRCGLRRRIGLGRGPEIVPLAQGAVEHALGLGPVAGQGFELAEGGLDLERLLAEVRLHAVEEAHAAEGGSHFDDAGGFGGGAGVEVAAERVEDAGEVGLLGGSERGIGGAEAVAEAVAAAAGLAGGGAGAGALAGVGAVGSDLRGGGHGPGIGTTYFYGSALGKGKRRITAASD
jgi:hypothetical protein